MRTRTLTWLALIHLALFASLNGCGRQLTGEDIRAISETLIPAVTTVLDKDKGQDEKILAALGAATEVIAKVKEAPPAQPRSVVSTVLASGANVNDAQLVDTGSLATIVGGAAVVAGAVAARRKRKG